MALPSTDTLDFVSWGLPVEYPINLVTSPNVDTDTLDYVSWGLPAAYTYNITPAAAGGSIIDVMGPGVTPFQRT